MFTKLANWLDHRCGYRRFVSAMLIEDIPGGARWRYVWGSCLAFVFLVQLITGVLLMTSYSAGDSTAWSSVYFIQYQMDFGWLIRGLHHFGSQTMVVLLGLHMLQVVIAGAHLPPREINWWLGLALMGAVLGLSLTGYLLPWDQKGYWATQVATNIAGNLPGGEWIKKIVVGGPEYGHHTLTRFYASHVGILPPLVIVLTIVHIYVFRRHGVTAPVGAKGEGWFWPDQAFKDLVACLAVFGIMLALVVAGDGHKLEAPSSQTAAVNPSNLYETWAKAGREGRGANLDAPADPSKAYPARPEWYFLGLFQLLKYFEGSKEYIGTVVIPFALGAVLAILPLLAFGRTRADGGVVRALAHGIAILFVVSLLTAIGTLTCLALADDTVNSLPRAIIKHVGTILLPATAVFFVVYLGFLSLLGPSVFRQLVFWTGALVVTVLLAGSGYLLEAALHGKELPPQVVKWVQSRMTAEDKKPSEVAAKFRKELASAEEQAGRAIQLAGAGVPAEGAVVILRRDPVTRGKELFATNCAGCHSFGKEFEREKFTASNLDGFGSERWIHDLLTNPGDNNFFGRTGRTTMKDFIEESFPNLNLGPAEEAKLAAQDKAKLQQDRKDMQTVAEWLAGHPRKDSRAADTAAFKDGLKLFKERGCGGCHAYEGEGGTRKNHGPDLTGYGTAEWLRQMLMMPSHESRYGLKNTMPAFRDLEGPTAAITRLELKDAREARLKDADPKAKAAADKAFGVMHLGDVDRELIIRWLLHDPQMVFGGEPIAESEK